MDDKNALLEQQNQITYRLGEIERRERIEKAKTFVGKFLMYPRNCYSCPEKESDYWNVYYAVLAVGDDGHLSALKFETDSCGAYMMSIEDRLSWGMLTEISPADFHAALKQFSDGVANLIKLGCQS